MAMPSATTAPIGAGLAFAIERHRAALAELTRSCLVYSACEEAAQKFRTPETVAAMEAAEAVTDIDGERELVTRLRFLSEPVTTMAEVQAKAQYIAANALALDYDEQMTALVTSMGAAEGARHVSQLPEPDPMNAAVAAYLVTLREQQACETADDTEGAEAASTRAVSMWQQLQAQPPAITSLAGAAAALRFVLSDTNWLDADHAKILAPALAFLDGEAL